MRYFAALLLLALPAPALADDVTTIAIEVIAEGVTGEPGGERFVSEGSFDPSTIPAIAAFGPFRVLDSTRAALVDAKAHLTETTLPLLASILNLSASRDSASC